MKRRVISVILTVVLLAAMAIAPAGAMAAKKIQILQVTVKGARLRQGPSSNYSVKKSLDKGAKVFYLGKIKNSFAHVRTTGGTEGYVYKGFLKKYGTCYKNQVYYNSKSSLKVYKKPSTHSSRVARLSKNQHVIVYQVKGNWAYIKMVSGKGGYCKASALRKAF